MSMKVSQDGELRDATKSEAAEIEQTQADDAAIDTARQQAVASIRAKLSALGLSDAEIAALVGG